MHLISIDPDLIKAIPKTRLGCIQCQVNVKENQADLAETIQTAVNELQQKLSVEDISKLPPISASRKAYKTLGKDPARYRLSAEALLRRVVKGKGLYQINNVVDALNLVSIQTGYSIAGYDADQLSGPIQLGVGKKEEPFEGIGRGTLNIENLPIFRDDKGAVGSPTSDSMRTRVTPETTKFLMIFYDFEGLDALAGAMKLAEELLERFTSATQLQRFIYNE